MKKKNDPQKVSGINSTGQGIQSIGIDKFYQDVVETIREPVLVLDMDLKVLYANPNFYKTFKVNAKETIGNLFFTLGDNQWDIPALRKLLEDVSKNQTSFDDFQVDHEFSSIGRRNMIVNARQVVNPGLRQVLILVAIDDITDRVQTEQALQNSEERFRRAFETAKDSILLIEKTNGQIVNSNQAAQDLLGYTAAELLKEKIWGLGFIKDAKDFQKVVRKLKDLGFVDYFDSSVKTKQGDEISTEIYITNRAKVFQCNIRDITARKRAEEELRESEEKYRNVVERANDGVVIIQDGKVRFANPRLAEINGSTVSEIVNTPFTDYIHPDDLDKVTDRYRRRMAGEAIVPVYEVALQKKNGAKVLAELNTGVISFEGKPANLVIVRDITHRKKVEQALKNEQEKAQKYLDIAEVMILVLDQNGETLLINQKGEQTLGYQENELIGKNWFDTCIPKRNRREIKGVFKKVMAGGSYLPQYNENLVLTKSGEERVIAWNYTCLYNEKKHFVGTLNSGEDITDRVRAEKLLNALNTASVAMSTALTQQDIFFAVKGALADLDIACMLFLLDETGNRLRLSYLSFQQPVLNMIEKLIGVDQQNISFLVDTVDVYRKVVREKEMVFAENFERVLQQVMPKGPGMFAPKIVDLLHTQKGIFAPLIMENQVIGVFSIQSNTLTLSDVPATSAFAHELAGAWNKTKLVQELRKAMEGTIHTIAAMVEVRDPYTAGHQKRVADLAGAIASEMKLPDEQVEGIKMAGTIHDLGKIRVPAEILSKPGKLSELEFNLIKAHPQDGFDLLKNIEFPWPLAQIVLQHHEKMDGSGYPKGLKKDEILIEARVLCVADIVEAMSSHRPYRSALGIEKALEQITLDRVTLLDPDAVDACLRVFKGGYNFPIDENSENL